MGYKLLGTPGTASFYKDHYGLDITEVTKPVDKDDSGPGSALDAIKEGGVELVINISEGTTRRDEITAGYLVRRAAVDFGIGLITNVKCAVWLAIAMGKGMETFKAKSISEFYSLHKN